MTTAPALLLALTICLQTPQPPPLTEAQRETIGRLARETHQETLRLRAALAELQRQLAELYAQYELDLDQAGRLEAEILDLQRQLLAQYRHMQVELRRVVDRERFTLLKQRIDRMLHPPPAMETKDQPSAPAASDTPR